MKKAAQVVNTAAKLALKPSDEAPPTFEYYPEFDGTTMKILNPVEHIRSMKPIGSKARVNIRVLAGIAKPSPKMGQALGPLGINMNQFCKDFNTRTAFIKSDVPMKATVIAYPDRTFGFYVKPPETSWFLRKCTGKEKFTNYAGHMNFDKLDMRYIYEIALIKKELDPEMCFMDLEQITKCIVAQCASMGIRPVWDAPPHAIIKVPFKG